MKTIDKLITYVNGTAVTDEVTTFLGQKDLSAYAKLDSPILTGTPTAPTATTGSSNGQIATTESTSIAVANSMPLVVEFDTSQSTETVTASSRRILYRVPCGTTGADILAAFQSGRSILLHNTSSTALANTFPGNCYVQPNIEYLGNINRIPFSFTRTMMSSTYTNNWPLRVVYGYFINNSTDQYFYVYTPEISMGMEGGLATFSVGASSKASLAITYSGSYSSSPAVYLSWHSNSTSINYGYLTCTTTGLSSTGFTLNVYNAYTSSFAPQVRWLAIDGKALTYWTNSSNS